MKVKAISNLSTMYTAQNMALLTPDGRYYVSVCIVQEAGVKSVVWETSTGKMRTFPAVEYGTMSYIAYSKAQKCLLAVVNTSRGIVRYFRLISQLVNQFLQHIINISGRFHMVL